MNKKINMIDGKTLFHVNLDILLPILLLFLHISLTHSVPVLATATMQELQKPIDISTCPAGSVVRAHMYCYTVMIFIYRHVTTPLT